MIPRMNRLSRIFVAGGDSFLGAAILDHLSESGFINLIGVGDCEPRLSSAEATERFFARFRPEFVFLVGAPPRTIHRSRTADRMLESLRSTANALDSSRRHEVRKLLYLIDARAMPTRPCHSARDSAPSRLDDPHDPMGSAAIAGWNLCESYRRQYACPFYAGITAPAFGPHADFQESLGGEIPSLILRIHQAAIRNDRAVVIPAGPTCTGSLYSRDIADACLFAMNWHEGNARINLGHREEIGIQDAARWIAKLVGYRGQMVFETTHQHGAATLDVSHLYDMGWSPSTDWRLAITETYRWFRGSIACGQRVH